ncbi:MAG: DUF2946 family protein [Pseudomonadota bacterium]
MGSLLARGAVREWLVVLVLAGFALQSATPALALMAKVSDDLALGPLGAFICHVPQPGEDPLIPGGEASAKGDGCCLICQAASLAKGALPPQTLHIPTRDAAVAFETADPPRAAGRDASRHKLPRAPPAA